MELGIQLQADGDGSRECREREDKHLSRRHESRLDHPRTTVEGTEQLIHFIIAGDMIRVVVGCIGAGMGKNRTEKRPPEEAPVEGAKVKVGYRPSQRYRCN